jgi:hypothetical protein
MGSVGALSMLGRRRSWIRDSRRRFFLSDLCIIEYPASGFRISS